MKMYNSKTRYYKNKYLIAFYDKKGEEFVHMFDNVVQILEYKNVELTKYNLYLHRVELCKSLKSDNHFTKMLDGTLMTVWLIDINDETESLDY